VRAHPFAIHRLTENTQPETLIAIGISIALEKQFDYKIPKLLLVENPEDLPSLLKGYEYVPARSDKERKEQLRRFLPTVMRQVRETVWKPRRLPFIEFPIPTLASFETITQEPNLDVATSVQQPPEKISDPDLDSRLDKRIGELDLSDLATSCLRDADIRTVRDLVQRTAEDLRGLRKFTRKNLKEVNRALNVLKLRLKASPVKTSGANQYKIRVYDLARELKLDNKKIMEDARREGIAVSVPSNTLPHEVAERIRLKYFPKKIAPQVGPRLVKHAKAVDELLSAGVGGVSATAAEQRFARPEESALPRPNVRVLKAQRPTLEVAKTTSGELSRALSQRPALRDTSSGRDHGTVVEAYPDATFLVRTPEGLEILATVSDKMRNNLITVLPGDTVTLQFARRDSRMARIVYRHRE